MISVSIVLFAVAYGISFAILRKKKVSVRILGGAVLGFVFVGAFLVLIILGGDSAEPGAVTYTERK